MIDRLAAAAGLFKRALIVEQKPVGLLPTAFELSEFDLLLPDSLIGAPCLPRPVSKEVFCDRLEQFSALLQRFPFRGAAGGPPVAVLSRLRPRPGEIKIVARRLGVTAEAFERGLFTPNLCAEIGPLPAQRLDVPPDGRTLARIIVDGIVRFLNSSNYSVICHYGLKMCEWDKSVAGR
ncbi:MAG: hypothetical protein NXI12_05525 [Alphaproteobacteria bacterium]|nr:hypothetical protein [Alphaproteobacteria bacterium]